MIATATEAPAGLSVSTACAIVEAAISTSRAQGSGAALYVGSTLAAWAFLRERAAANFRDYAAGLPHGDRLELERALREARATPQGAGAAAVLPGYSFAEVWMDDKPPDYVVKGVAEPGAKTVIFGESGSMKTFAATDLVLHAAAGRDWHGRRVRQCAALVVLGEGQQGYRKRLRAWAIANGLADGDLLPVWVCPQALDLMLASTTLEHWIAAAEARLGQPVGIVLIDTLSTNLGTGDESANRDVTLALNEASRAAGNRALLLVHHVGHGDKTRERGAYQIRANADFRVLVTRDDDNRGRVVTLSCEKSKDGEAWAPIALEWRQVDTGWIDADGEPVTSVVLGSTDRTPVAGAAAIGRNQRALLTILQQAGGQMGKAELRQAWADAGHDRRRYAEALHGLIAAGLIFDGMQRFALVSEQGIA